MSFIHVSTETGDHIATFYISTDPAIRAFVGEMVIDCAVRGFVVSTQAKSLAPPAAPSATGTSTSTGAPASTQISITQRPRAKASTIGARGAGSSGGLKVDDIDTSSTERPQRAWSRQRPLASAPVDEIAFKEGDSVRLAWDSIVMTRQLVMQAHKLQTGTVVEVRRRQGVRLGVGVKFATEDFPVWFGRHELVKA